MDNPLWINGQSYHYQIRYRCSICLRECVQILARKRPHLQNLHSNLWNIHTTPKLCVMFNNIVNVNHTITKFATIVPYTCMIIYSYFGEKRTTFAEVTLKNRMSPSSRTRACGHRQGEEGSIDNHIITKFATFVPRAYTSTSPNFGKNTTTVEEVTQ